MDDLRQIAEKTFKDSQSFNSTLHRVGKLSIRRRDDIGALIHNRSEYHCPFNGFSGNDDKSCLGLLNAETTSNIPHVAGVTGVPVERDHAYVVPPPTSEALQTDGDDHKPSTLELVVVAQPPTLEMGIHAHVFLGLFHRYKIEPYILRLIARNVDGFYEFPQSSEGPHLAHISYFLHVRNRFMLAWSYALENASTDAILIARPTGSDQLVQDVIAHKGLLGHPLSLALVCCAHLLDGIRIEIGPELATIADTEAQTGFNPFEGGSVDTRRFLGGQKPDADHLDVLSGMMSSTGVVLALHRKYLGFVRGLLERMTLSRLLADVWRDAISEGRWDEYENLCRRISEVSSVLMPECDMTTPYIALLKERADVQQRVLENIMAKQEYLATIELAKDSRSIALATKYDSSSMKGIAFVTMAFLPATFFAALFAMPLFDWDATTVIKDRFWVYLALALPATTIIPAVWFVVSCLQHQSRERLEKEERRRVATTWSQTVPPEAATPPRLTRRRTQGSDDDLVGLKRRESRLARAIRRFGRRN